MYLAPELLVPRREFELPVHHNLEFPSNPRIEVQLSGIMQSDGKSGFNFALSDGQVTKELCNFPLVLKRLPVGVRVQKIVLIESGNHQASVELFDSNY